MPEIECAGVRTWYEAHGEGAETVVLLHGGLMSGDSWQPAIPWFADAYRVVIPDRRGHGRTADVDGPYTYEAMAEETVAFVEQVVEGPAHLVGYSDGGCVALHVARDRPDFVRTVVTIGANYHWEGLLPAALDGMAHLDPDAPEMASLREPYATVSPDGGDHWPVFVRKVAEMGRTGPTMTVEEIGAITMPALVVAGDDDIVSHGHTVALFEALPQGQLAIIPGTSHALPAEKPDLLLSLIKGFLAGGPPERMIPMRFAPPEGA